MFVDLDWYFDKTNQGQVFALDLCAAKKIIGKRELLITATRIHAIKKVTFTPKTANSNHWRNCLSSSAFALFIKEGFKPHAWVNCSFIS